MPTLPAPCVKSTNTTKDIIQACPHTNEHFSQISQSQASCQSQHSQHPLASLRLSLHSIQRRCILIERCVKKTAAPCIIYFKKYVSLGGSDFLRLLAARIGQPKDPPTKDPPKTSTERRAASATGVAAACRSKRCPMTATSEDDRKFKCNFKLTWETDTWVGHSLVWPHD